MRWFRPVIKERRSDACLCDLHIHTTFSDGLLTPEQAVLTAREKGLSVIAIVDHDAIGGITPAIKKGKEFEMEIIPAVELSCLVKDIDIHIIGYFIDYKNSKLKGILSEIQKSRLERAKKMVEKLAQQGAEVEIERVLELAGHGAVGRPHIAQVLLEEGYISCYDEAFWKYIGYHCPAYVPKEKFSPKQAIKLIKQFHGVSVLAHPLSYNNHSIIDFLIEEGVQGLEVWRPDHTESDVKYLTNYALNHRRLITGGSDCHGGRKGKITIGEVKIPYKYVKELKNAR
ncbi:MAG: PHP domain-containing protein [candidate division WOR-3 bacterium]|nr:PHP domain-containing protein [candidate division WOR-3 bacterium]